MGSCLYMTSRTVFPRARTCTTVEPDPSGSAVQRRAAGTGRFRRGRRPATSHHSAGAGTSGELVDGEAGGPLLGMHRRLQHEAKRLHRHHLPGYHWIAERWRRIRRCCVEPRHRRAGRIGNLLDAFDVYRIGGVRAATGIERALGTGTTGILPSYPPNSARRIMRQLVLLIRYEPQASPPEGDPPAMWVKSGPGTITYLDGDPSAAPGRSPTRPA